MTVFEGPRWDRPTRRRVARRWFGLVLGLALCGYGCATSPGKGDGQLASRGVGVSGRPTDQVRSSLIAYLTRNGFELSDADRRTLNFDRSPSTWTVMRFGSFVNPGTFVRMKVFIMEVGAGDLWIGYEPRVVTERGSGFEQETPLKGKGAREMQSMLTAWKAGLSNGG